VSYRLVVVGGGLAGIAAAIRLAEAGEKPLLIEARKKLGGRATSFIDPRINVELDNCQHVVMGCCTNLLDLYERIGVLQHIDWYNKLFWTTGNGEIDVIKPGLLPAPFHLASGINRLRFLTKADRKAIRKAMWKLIRMGSKGRQQWMGKKFIDFLSQHNQTIGAIDRFWNVILVSALNIDVKLADAGYAIQIFQDGFLANHFGCSMGLPTVLLKKLYDPAVEIIEKHGGDVVDGISAKSLAFDGKRVTGVVTPDGVINVSSVVVAVPFDRLDKLISNTMRHADTRLQKLGKFQFSPILGVHLWFDQIIMDLPHLVCVDTGVQWLFNKGKENNGLQHVHAVISAADEWMELTEKEIVDRVVVDIHKILPGSKGLQPVEARSVKEKRATFAVTPGIDKIRPGSAPGPIGLSGGGIRNLYLAGDWCNTGWPATMEGAVRSGYEAAAAITGCEYTIADLPPGILARLLGLKSTGQLAG